MQIVIDIPDNKIPKTQDIIDISLHFIDEQVCECDYPFKVLPKGHGRLIDEDKATDLLYEQEYNYYTEIDKVCDTIAETPTIIEADKG